jgi:hypothetical protein
MSAPTVSSISPASGTYAGGTSVTLTGTNFTGATSVTIGGTAATGLSVVSATSITCTTPAGTAGAASVLVTTPGGTNVGNSLYTYLPPAPTVTAIFPASGTYAGGTSVTLTGTNFTGATAVTIGGTAATSVTVVSATSITCTTPAGTAGAASVLVTTPSGANAGNSLYTYLPPAPTVTAISPTSGTVNGGTGVTITGTNFTGATGVTLGGTAPASFTVVSATSITCATPVGSAGAQSVRVTTPSGTNAANTLFAYVLTPPTVTAISPSTASSVGGTSVMITGTNFIGTTGVTFQGVAATSFSVVSSTSITCTLPAGSVGVANVLVLSPSGTNAANNLFSYVPPPPTVTSVSPTNGSTVGGTTVTITGTSLTQTIGVTIGGVTATNVTVINDTSITCITPAGSVEMASVLVTTLSGINAANTLYTYELTPPTVTGIYPPYGTTAGSTPVTITGTHFTGTTSVTIGGAAATSITVVNDTSITCITPLGSAGAASVLVTTSTDTNAPNTLYTYRKALPAVTSVSPPLGAATGGTTVTLTGSYLTGATSVTFGGIAATSVTVVNDTTLTCTTPTGSAGPASVLVTTAAGTNALNGLFVYILAVPADTYIYLNGGRGDGFVPLWTGTLSEEGLVDKNGNVLVLGGQEMSEPYRDIFTSSSLTQNYTSFYWGNPQPVTSVANNVYTDDGRPSAYNGNSRLSDEVAHAKPRQYVRLGTWLIFTSQSGLTYKFRKDQVLGWGSQPRA